MTPWIGRLTSKGARNQIERKDDITTNSTTTTTSLVDMQTENNKSQQVKNKIAWKKRIGRHKLFIFKESQGINP